MISERIQEQRKLSGLTQEQLAEKLNVSRQSISKWESDQSLPEIDRIILMSEIFNISTDYLLKGVEVENVKINTKKDYTLFGTTLILIGFIVSLSLWYDYRTFISISIGVIIQVIGILLFFYSDVKSSKSYKLKFLFSFWIGLIIPLNLIFNFLISKSLTLFLPKPPIPFILLSLYIIVGTLGSISINYYLKK